MSADDDMQQRLQELESQLAFQEELNQQLNEVVVRQDRDIERIKQQVAALSRRIKEVGEAMPGQSDDPMDEVPPHY